MVNYKINEQVKQFSQEYNRISDLIVIKDKLGYFFYNYCPAVKKNQLTKYAPL